MSALAPIIGLVLAISILFHLAGRSGGPLVAPVLLPEVYDDESRAILRRSFDLDDDSARTVRRALFAAQVLERRDRSGVVTPDVRALRDRARELAANPHPAKRDEIERLIADIIPPRA